MKKEKLTICYEDKHLLIVNKKSGLLTISDGKSLNTLYHQVRKYLFKKNQKVFIVHRLDKDTSGLVVFAKSEKVKRALQSNWNEVKRYYKALVSGKLEMDEGIIRNYLKEDKFFNVYETKKSDGMLAITKYKVIERYKDTTLVDIEILTGKKHQIRVGFKSIGHPIVGDSRYFQKSSLRMCLHAYRIVLEHPITHQKLDILYEQPFK